MLNTTENCDDFVSATVNAKSEIVSRLVLMARKERAPPASAKAP